jgi:serine/threonine protein kinase
VAIKQVAKGTTGKKRSDTEAARKEIFFGSYLFGPGGEPKLAPARYPGIQHIAKLLDHAETKRDIWLVMEYGGTSLTKVAYEIKGEFLRGERLYRVNHLPVLQSMKQNPAVLRSMLRQLLSALCILADHHIVHSDIKPDNILVEEDERRQLKVRFIDLGSAFTFDCPESLALATPEYMPPEALETCIARNPLMGGMGGCRHGFGRLGGNAGPLGGGAPRRGGSGAAAAPVDPVQKLQRQAQPWSFDTWSLGSILLELCLGAPLWLSYKCRVADDQRANSAATGLFAVPGRDPEKIMMKQQDALCQRGLHAVLRNAAGVPLDGSGRELLSAMLAWDPIARISPQEALRHPWLTQDGTGAY